MRCIDESRGFACFARLAHDFLARSLANGANFKTASETADRDLVLQAITDYAEKNVDFADAYNAGWLLSEELKAVYTFDRRHFSRFEGITVRIPGED